MTTTRAQTPRMIKPGLGKAKGPASKHGPGIVPKGQKEDKPQRKTPR